MPQGRTDFKTVSYPDYVVETLHRILQASGSERYPLFNKRIDVIQMLFNYGEKYPISEQVYNYVWILINKMVSVGNDTWIKEYWTYATQYMMSVYEYSDDREGERRFAEHHLMVGPLLVYMERYDLLRHIMNFTSSLPARYPLVPSTFRTTYDWYKELSRKNEQLYLLRYHIKGMNEGAREENKIEGLLLDYIALLLIRLNTVNDYNITYSDPMEMPDTGATIEETVRNYDIAEALKNRISRWLEKKEFLRQMGFSDDDARIGQRLLTEYQELCDHQREDLDRNADVSEVKREALKNDMVQACSVVKTNLPMTENSGDDGKTANHLVANQSVDLDDNLILTGRDSISNNLGEALINALFVEIRLNYCFQFLLHGSPYSFSIPYRDMSKALTRLHIDSNYTILSMGVSMHFFEEVDGFKRDANMKLKYGDSNVIEIVSNENSLIIMKTDDVPSIELRDLTEEEKSEAFTEIDEANHIYSNIDGITPDDMNLKASIGYTIRIKEPMKYVRLRIAYRLDSDNVVLKRVQPIKNYIV